MCFANVGDILLKGCKLIPGEVGRRPCLVLLVAYEGCACNAYSIHKANTSKHQNVKLNAFCVDWNGDRYDYGRRNAFRERRQKGSGCATLWGVSTGVGRGWIFKKGRCPTQVRKLRSVVKHPKRSQFAAPAGDIYCSRKTRHKHEATPRQRLGHGDVRRTLYPTLFASHFATPRVVNTSPSLSPPTTATGSPDLTPLTPRAPSPRNSRASLAEPNAAQATTTSDGGMICTVC